MAQDNLDYRMTNVTSLDGNRPLSSHGRTKYRENG